MGSVRLSQDLRSTIRYNALDAFRTGNVEPVMPNEKQEVLFKAIYASPMQKYARSLDDHAKTFGLEVTEHKTTNGRYANETYKFYGLNGKTHKYTSLSSKRDYYLTMRPPEERDLSDQRIRFNWHASLFNKEQRAKYGDATGQIDLRFFELNRPYRKLSLYSNNTATMWGATEVDLADLNDEDVPACLDILLYEANRVVEHSKKQTDFEQQIRSLLSKCNTLRQAIDAWPGIREFVPDHILRKLYQKTTRVQKAKTIREEIAFDSALADQVVLKSKLLGE
tara:strand:+ start:2650 stop:3489 length:840 start_codon:yes stop_codon:yes gene_type:complete